MVAAVTVRASGKAEFAYVGEKAWHGLGTELPGGRPIAEWKVAAGMDWEAKRTRVHLGDGSTFDEHHVIYRKIEGKTVPLGIVGHKFELVQPGEILEFFEDLVHGEGFSLNTAGTLHEGRKFFALAKLDDDVVLGGDHIRAHLLLATALDGSMKTIGKFVDERVVCQNTMTIGLKESGHQFAISHRSKFDADVMKKKLTIMRGERKEFILQMRMLAQTPVNTAFADQFLGELLTETGTVSAKDVTKAAAYKKIRELFVDGTAIGANLEGADGTAWGLLNCVTEYVDHHAKADNESIRFEKAMFGRGDELKTFARQKLLATV